MKKFKSMIILLGITMLLGGCGSANAQTTLAQQTQQTQQTQETQETKQTVEKDLALQERQTPDLVGEITTILGNEITLKLANMPDIEKMNPPQDQENVSNVEQTKQKEQPKAITGSTDTGMPGGGGMPGGMPGGGMPGGGQNGAATRQSGANKQDKQRAAIALEYTGEEKTITIPVGMSISGGRGQQEVTFETLQQGNVIGIWLDDAGNVERASFIGGGIQ